jgi:hypothetical protein
VGALWGGNRRPRHRRRRRVVSRLSGRTDGNSQSKKTSLRNHGQTPKTFFGDPASPTAPTAATYDLLSLGEVLGQRLRRTTSSTRMRSSAGALPTGSPSSGISKYAAFCAWPPNAPWQVRRRGLVSRKQECTSRRAKGRHAHRNWGLNPGRKGRPGQQLQLTTIELRISTPDRLLAVTGRSTTTKPALGTEPGSRIRPGGGREADSPSRMRVLQVYLRRERARFRRA